MDRLASIVRFVAVVLLLSGAEGALAQAQEKPTATRSTGKPATTPTDQQGDAEVARRAQVVARFEGGAITIAELEDSIVRQSPYMRRRYSDPAARKELLDRLVRFALLAREAAARGYAKNPDVVESVKETTIQQLMQEAVDDAVSEATISPEEVAKHYAENRDEFLRPATRRAAQVLLATEEEAKALLEKARAADLREFRELARRDSVDEATKVRGGDLGYFDAKGIVSGEEAPSVPEAIVKGVFALENVGDIAPAPVAIEGGYSIVKLTGSRPATERSVEAADATIRARLARDKRREASLAFIDKLKAEHKPVVNAELLDLVVP